MKIQKTWQIRISTLCAVVLWMACGFFSNLWAFEIITEEDIRQEIVVSEDLIKTADNAIFLFDSSSAMNKPYKDTGMTRYKVAKKTLMERDLSGSEI